MDKKEGNVRSRIIKAAFDIVKQNGFDNITIRKIANTADVNIAAVNYYFGSKDNIINEVIRTALDSILDIFDILDDKNIECKERLKIFLIRYADSAIIYPCFNKSLLERITNDNINEDTYDMLKMQFEKLKSTLAEFIKSNNEDIICMKMIQIMAGIIYPAIMNEKTLSLFGFDYLNRDYRENYIDLLLENIR